MSKNNKFREFLKLNFQMIPWYSYIFAVFAGIAFATIQRSLFYDENSMISTGRLYGIIFLTVAVFLLIFPIIEKICSETLFQKDAYFYQSFPVTSFQTAFVKTITSGSLLAMIPLGFEITIFIEEDGIGIPLLLSIFLLSVAFGFVSGGIVLQSYSIGNNFKNAKTGKPNRAVSYGEILFFAIVLIYMFRNINDWLNADVEIKILWVSLILMVIGGICFFVNIKIIKCRYEA